MQVDLQSIMISLHLGGSETAKYTNPKFHTVLTIRSQIASGHLMQYITIQ